MCHDSTSQFEVERLSLTKFQLSGIGVEISLEVGYGHTVGVLIVNAQSSANVHVG